MKTYLVLYLFTKLNEIRNILQNDFGYTALTCLFVLVLVGIKAAYYKDGSGDRYPFSGLINKKMDDNLRKFVSSKARIIIYVFIVQIICNIIAVTLPSTKQAAFIIVTGKGINSETFKAISDLDDTFAKWIKSKAKEYMRETIENDKSINIPKETSKESKETTKSKSNTKQVLT